MGNKPSVSEGEDDEDRSPLALKSARSAAAAELTNGGGEDVDEELELPPPMKPIQEPILVASGPPSIPGVPDIVENPCKRVSAAGFARRWFNLTLKGILQVSSLTLTSLEGGTSADLAEIEQIVKERMVRSVMYFIGVCARFFLFFFGIA